MSISIPWFESTLQPMANDLEASNIVEPILSSSKKTSPLISILQPDVGMLVDTMTTEEDEFDDDDAKLNHDLRRQQQQMQLAAEQGGRRPRSNTYN